MILDRTGSIQRLTAQAGTDKEAYQIVSGLEAVSLHIQPASAETVALSEGVFGKTYTVFTQRSGIKDGDRLTISGTFIDGLSTNKTIQVQSVGNWNFAPLAHFEITCIDYE